MLKTKVTLDQQAITNEIVSRFDATFADYIANTAEEDFDTDDVSNICNDAVKSVIDEINQEY